MLCMQQFVVFVVLLVAMSCLTLVTPWTEAHQALSVGFPRQEHRSGLPFSSLRIFLTQRSNLHPLHWQVDSLPLSHLGSHYVAIASGKEKLFTPGQQQDSDTFLLCTLLHILNLVPKQIMF